MFYAFVDANIFVRIVTQGRPGCEPQRFADLTTLVEGKELGLIVPEVLGLELEKNFRLLPKQIESHCDKLADAVAKATENTWNEIDALKIDILGRIKDYKRQKVLECSQVSARVMEFLKSNSVDVVPLTPDLWVAAKRRLIAGRMPKHSRSSDQDAALIESLIAFFAGSGMDQAELLFCSENTQDFAVEITNEREKQFALDPLLQDGLPRAYYSTDLAAMLAFAQGYETLPEPDSEQIQHAVKMRDLHDEDDDEYWMRQKALEDVIHSEAIAEFKSTVMPNLPEEANRLRQRLGLEVRRLLMDCRSCSSWNDRSEMKLGQWVEYVPEEMIPYTSLPKLVRIRKSLEEYLELHRKMDRESD